MSKSGGPGDDQGTGDDGFNPELFFHFLRGYGHGKLLNLDYRDSGPDWIEAALPWREELVALTDRGSLASSVLVSLLDTCSGAAVFQRLGGVTRSATIDLRIDYLRPALRGETVVARCECYRVTRRVAFVRGVARGEADGDPIAQAVGTFIISA